MSASRFANTLLLARKLSSAASRSTDRTVGQVQTAVGASLFDQAAATLSGHFDSLHTSTRGIYSVCSLYASASQPITELEVPPNGRSYQLQQSQQSPSWAKPALSCSSLPLNAQKSPTATYSQTDRAPTNSSSKIPDELYITLKNMSRAGQLQEIMQLFSDHPELQHSHAFNVALLYLPTSRCELMPVLYDGLSRLGIQPDTVSLAKNIRALARLQRNSDATVLFQDWLEKGNPFEANIVAAYSAVLANLNDAEGVEALIEEAKAAGLPAVMAAYTALIRAWGQRGLLINVRQVLVDMKEDGVLPNELHYRAAITAHGRLLRPHEAHYMMTEMKEAGTQVSAHTYQALIEGYAVVKRPREVSRVMQDFVDNGGQPTLAMCNIVVKAWARTGEPGEVRAVMLNMRNLGLQPDLSTWGGLVHAHAVAVQPGKAAEVIGEMSSLGMRPGVVIYSMLMNAYGAAGDVAAADKVLQDMRGGGMHPNNYTYATLMTLYAQLGDVSKVLALQGDMKEQGLQMCAVTQLTVVEAAMEAWAQSGRPLSALAQAEALFQKCATPGPFKSTRSLSHRRWESMFLDLHGYGWWSCQLALVANLRRLYQDYCAPNYLWPDSDFVVNVGKGTNSIRRHEACVRDAVLHFLQHLAPVKLGKRNAGLVTIRRSDLWRLFDSARQEQLSIDAATFHECFTARQQQGDTVQNFMRRL